MSLRASSGGTSSFTTVTDRLEAGFDKWLPDGVRTSCAVEHGDNLQLGIEGYDPDHYMDMALTLPADEGASTRPGILKLNSASVTSMFPEMRIGLSSLRR